MTNKQDKRERYTYVRTTFKRGIVYKIHVCSTKMSVYMRLDVIKSKHYTSDTR
jgi:hypothetical protein